MGGHTCFLCPVACAAADVQDVQGSEGLFDLLAEAVLFLLAVGVSPFVYLFVFFGSVSVVFDYVVGHWVWMVFLVDIWMWVSVVGVFVGCHMVPGDAVIGCILVVYQNI